jgi:hypothetical protein
MNIYRGSKMVHFFRVKENGSVRNPTFTAIVVSFFLWIPTLILLRHSMIFAICVTLAEYVMSAVVFSKPIRLAVQRLLYMTRFPRIVGGLPSKSSVKWEEANKEMLSRANIVVFKGVGAQSSQKMTQIHKGQFENTVDLNTDKRTGTWRLD